MIKFRRLLGLLGSIGITVVGTTGVVSCTTKNNYIGIANVNANKRIKTFQLTTSPKVYEIKGNFTFNNVFEQEKKVGSFWFSINGKLSQGQYVYTNVSQWSLNEIFKDEITIVISWFKSEYSLQYVLLLEIKTDYNLDLYLKGVI